MTEFEKWRDRGYIVNLVGDDKEEALHNAEVGFIAGKFSRDAEVAELKRQLEEARDAALVEAA